jgi:hypothetical protein
MSSRYLFNSNKIATCKVKKTCFVTLLHSPSFCCLQSISPETRLILRRSPLRRSVAPCRTAVGTGACRAESGAFGPETEAAQNPN